MKRNLFAVLGTLVATACGSSGDSATDPGTSSGGEVPGETPPGEVVPPGEEPGSTPGGAPIAKNLTLNAVSFKNVGRRGDTLRIAVKGADTLKETSAIHVKLVDEADAPVVALDTDWDGVPDAAERRFHFDASTLGQATFTGTVLIPNAFPQTSKIAKVIVALEDEAGGQSATKSQPIALQLTKGENEACDPLQVADRCQEGMACAGTPSACLAGVAPQLTRVGYFGGASPRMIFQGNEPDEDLKSVGVEFLDASGNPKTVNLGSEDAPEMSGAITLDARSAPPGAAFTLMSTPIQGFDALVPKIAATVTDAYGHASTRVVAAAAALPVRSAGQACDAGGFDTCATGNVCAPGLAGVENKCAAATTVRTAKCAAGAALDPATPKKRAFGVVAGASLWEPPAGCVPAESLTRPETAVRLHLGALAPTLVVTTALPETDFDTAIYVIPACAATSAAALGCNDDVQGFSSTLTLQNVPAGDYTIVVESIQARGGRFGLSVEVK